MSPLSDQPYKSRVLNFFNRQVLRFGDRAQTTLRQLKTATVWGAQLLAYPIYLLLQTSTRVGKQLQTQAVKLLAPSQQPETPSVGSQPTNVILASLQPWLKHTPYQLLPPPPSQPSFWEKVRFFRKKKKNKAKFNYKPPSPPQKKGFLGKIPFVSAALSQYGENAKKETYVIQGVATDLETGKLVLVTTNNQSIDLLSHWQHEQLKERIKIIVECYAQIQQPWWWRIATERKTSGFNPLLWVSKLMVWIQTSSLAKRLNWFQESQLTFSANGWGEISQTPPQSPQGGVMEKLDRVLSRWENTKLRPVVEKIKQWRDSLDHQDQDNRLLSLIRSAVDYFYGVKPQNQLTGETTSEQPSGFLKSISTLLQGENNDSLTIQSLIQAAIEHFFGNPQQQLSVPNSPVESSDEPWLTKADLFTENQTPKPLAPGKENESNLSIELPHQLNPHYFTVTTPPLLPPGKETQETSSESGYNAFQAEAIPLGYEKHILARILEWLDRILAWLEEKLLKLWQWLKQLISRKKS